MVKLTANATVIPLCRQIKANGIRCGSPAMRGSDLCFFHDPAARERHEAAALALRTNYGKVMLREMMRIWPARATRDERALLEYALQIFDNLES